MKKILQISTILIATVFYGQNVSDYKYIYVPYTFQNVKANKFGLNDVLTSKLKQKKYIIIKESKVNWPAELAENPCNVLTAELTDTSNMFKNKANISFTDCENKAILSLEGKSSTKEFEPGMHEALEDAIKKLPASTQEEKKFVRKPQETKKEVALVPEIKTSQIKESTTAQKAEVYSNGSLTLNKIFLTNGEFILVNPNNSIPYATFKPSGKKDVYRVKLSDGTSTIGYLEDGKIAIELTNSDGNFSTEIFSKK